MADELDNAGKKKQYSPYSKTPIVFSRGMFTDTNEEFQPEGTYRFALNANLITETGEKGALSNEEGNRSCIDLQDDEARVIGSCLLNNGKVVLFIYHSAHGIYPAHSAIAIQNEDCTLEYVIRSECLEFLPTDVINCEYKIQSGCDTILYFTDRRTKYKYINISKLGFYVLEGRSIADANTPVAGEFGWDCGLFNFDANYNIPKIQLESVQFGGRLRIGAYFVSLRYLDDSLNGTNWTPASNPIYITYPTGDINPMEVSGGILNVNTLEDGYYITAKAIRLSIQDLDPRYRYFQLTIFEFTQGTDSNNLTFVSPYYNINGDEASVLITELSASAGFTSESSANITIPKEYIDIVRAHTQVDRRLILGNLTNIVTDWSKFQKAANEVKSVYFTYDAVANTNTNNCGTEVINQMELTGNQGTEFNNAEFLFDQKTYMRDEVYSFAIVYVFKNGKESPAFHIPGRPAISDVDETTNDGIYSVTSYDSGFEVFDITTGRDRWYLDYINDIYGTNGQYDNYNAPLGGSWDRTPLSYEDAAVKPYVDYSAYDGLDSTVQVDPNDFTMANTVVDKSQNILLNNFCNGNNELERWQFVNTSIKFNTQNGAQSTTPFNELQLLTADRLYSGGLCAYYETNTRYPDVRDCDGIPIYPHTVIDGEYVMHRIRHHKMPDARKELLYDGLGNDDQNVLLSLKPLGMFFYNIQLPQGYEDEIQGFYIVRGDRAGNKTVIDKGWMNVCDVTFGVRLTPPSYIISDVTYTNERSIQQNPMWMIPTDKFGSLEDGNIYNPANGYKLMHITGSNYVEFFSPKSSFNEPVNLQGSYYKLENTIITTQIKNIENEYRALDVDPEWSGNVCDEPYAWEGRHSFEAYGVIEAYTLRLPRMFTWMDNEDFLLLHNVPIIYSEYTFYNQNNIAANSFTMNNDNHRQTIMLSKLYNERYDLEFENHLELNIGSLYKPKAYFTGSETTAVFGNPDLINPRTLVNNPTGFDTITMGNIIRNAAGVPLNLNSFRSWEYGHFYYAAIKSKAVVYSKLEDIIYIKASNQIQSFPGVGNAASFEKGGDCFIAKHRLFKSFERTTEEDPINNGAADGKLMGSVIVGYVESEINAHFRNKFSDDTNYYFRPIDSWTDSLKTAVKEVHLSETSQVDFIEHRYHYNLDFSADNRNRRFFPLPDVFDYCSQCSERYPHTIRYSEPSISTQVFDNYKIFQTNSVQEIPADTGEITNLFVKEQNLFVHTVSNLYRLNLAPQELETGNDRIQVGSGTIANSVPQRLFDNANGYGRGGTEFEHSGAFCNDMYIWVDNKSKRVYGLSKGLEELSAQGMTMWFRNNLNLTLRDQWKSFSGTDYPYLNTSDRQCIGFIGNFDPRFDRYIVHKKDYELGLFILNNLYEDVGEPYIPDSYYWNSTGLYVATTSSSLKTVNYEDDLNVKNKSFTISYSVLDKAWASFHSYRPNHIWNNNYTFFTTINNIQKADTIWEHNLKNYQTYYDVKHDFIYDYVAKGEEPIITKAFDNIEVMGNVYSYNTSSEQWREVFYSTFDRLHVYNNTQSSGLFNLVIKNPIAYYDVYNNFITTRTLSINRDRDIWKVNNLLDYTADASITGTQTINTTEWGFTDYSDYFTTNENMGYIDWAINPDYINENKNVYELQRFRDKFLNVRLFYKPVEDYKMVINTMANLKRALI